jgi:hypothetical protein
MFLFELGEFDPDTAKLAALSQFLLGRADDTDAKKTISVKSFLQLAANQGISLTQQRLQELSQQPPLSNIIAAVEDDTGNVVFKGGDTEKPEMTVDKAQDTVDKLAKRAASRGM